MTVPIRFQLPYPPVPRLPSSIRVLPVLVSVPVRLTVVPTTRLIVPMPAVVKPAPRLRVPAARSISPWLVHDAPPNARLAPLALTRRVPSAALVNVLEAEPRPTPVEVLSIRPWLTTEPVATPPPLSGPMYMLPPRSVRPAPIVRVSPLISVSKPGKPPTDDRTVPVPPMVDAGLRKRSQVDAPVNSTVPSTVRPLKIETLWLAGIRSFEPVGMVTPSSVPLAPCRTAPLLVFTVPPMTVPIRFQLPYPPVPRLPSSIRVLPVLVSVPVRLTVVPTTRLIVPMPA